MMVDPQNYEHHFPMKFWPFFKTKWPLLVVFCSLVSLVKKYATSKAKMALKKAFVHEETDVHSFESQTSLTNFLINVEHKCLRFSIRIRVYQIPFPKLSIFEDQPFLSLQNCLRCGILNLPPLCQL